MDHSEWFPNLYFVWHSEMKSYGRGGKNSDMLPHPVFSLIPVVFLCLACTCVNSFFMNLFSCSCHLFLARTLIYNNWYPKWLQEAELQIWEMNCWHIWGMLGSNGTWVLHSHYRQWHHDYSDSHWCWCGMKCIGRLWHWDIKWL